MLTCIFESVHEAKTSIEADQPDPKVTANSPRLMISSSFLRNGGVNLRIGAEGAPIGIPFEAGSQSEMSGSQRTIVGFEDADDFVFVLRMRETIGRKSGQVRQKQFKTATYSEWTRTYRRNIPTVRMNFTSSGLLVMFSTWKE